ncbi:molybdenum cofactor guanylyltransferase [Halegenticoccus soli]|uniref:molybdenum cofactor guanylyltransferase n=1 Tax=Halegenticoccus soli TaxID=1985678 RepID=UPI000C6CC971|nr:molybdenum cofactor guanylyltransferase [Halegenticoccus soli]
MTDTERGRPGAVKPDTGRAGVIVAGGRSTRFRGVDKATALVDGVPMIRRVAEAVAPAVDELVVNCRRDQREAFEAALSGLDARFAEDPILDRGPAAGVRTGLRAADAEYAAVVPCDAPLVPSAFLAFLLDRARHRTGAVPTVGGEVRPLPAAVHVRAATAACDDALRLFDGRLRDVVRVLEPDVVRERTVRAFADPGDFLNVDAPGDLRTAERRLRGARPADERGDDREVLDSGNT